MNVFPQDLGGHWHIDLVQTRTARRFGRGEFQGMLTGPKNEVNKKPVLTSKALSWVSRFWSGGASIDETMRREGLAGMAQRTARLRVLLGGAALFVVPAVGLAANGEMGGAVTMAVMGAWFGGLGLMVPRTLFGRAHNTPLQAREIEALLPLAPGDLERSYLTLILDTITLSPETIPAEAQEQIRAALRALGQALDALPYLAGGVSGASVGDADALRREAASVATEALNEPDPVTSASLSRQADALLRRADSLGRSATLVRRAQALRREMIAQTEALRAGLSGFHAGATDIAGLSDLAAAVQNVAGEAGQIAYARAELDGLNAKDEGGRMKDELREEDQPVAEGSGDSSFILHPSSLPESPQVQRVVLGGGGGTS